jgi:hypothetical protein
MANAKRMSCEQAIAAAWRVDQPAQKETVLTRQPWV